MPEDTFPIALVVYLEVGDRTSGDGAVWPDDDLHGVEIDGKRRVAHRDGTPC